VPFVGRLALKEIKLLEMQGTPNLTPALFPPTLGEREKNQNLTASAMGGHGWTCGGFIFFAPSMSLVFAKTTLH